MSKANSSRPRPKGRWVPPALIMLAALILFIILWRSLWLSEPAEGGWTTKEPEAFLIHYNGRTQGFARGTSGFESLMPAFDRIMTNLGAAVSCSFDADQIRELKHSGRGVEAVFSRRQILVIFDENAVCGRLVYFSESDYDGKPRRADLAPLEEAVEALLEDQ